MDHRQCLFFTLFTERQLHVLLAQCFTEVAVRILYAALPTWTQLLGASERLAVEFEVLIHEGRGKDRRGAVDKVPRHIYFPVVQAYFLNLRLQLLEEFGYRNVKGFDRGR